MRKRVDVYGGDGTKHLGLGYYVGNVTVYAFEVGDSLLSLPDCEVEPSSDIVIEMADKGGKLIAIPDNPKIVMDDGAIHYGCQVWWHPLDGEASQ